MSMAAWKRGACSPGLPVTGPRSPAHSILTLWVTKGLEFLLFYLSLLWGGSKHLVPPFSRAPSTPFPLVRPGASHLSALLHACCPRPLLRVLAG